MKVAILRDHNPQSSEKWELACQKLSIDFKVIDLLNDSSFDVLQSYAPTFCLSRPPGDIFQNKKIFDERLFFLENHLRYRIYPGFLETFIYENKASLAWFLKSNNIPHANTFIGTSLAESLQYLNTIDFPIVAKTLIGASGSGVRILKSKGEAKLYINKAFSSGIRRRFGPNRNAGSPKTWIEKAIKSPRYLASKIRQYRERYNDVQRGIVLLQEYIEHTFEWRCVKIGDSFFAYKKLKIGNQASGSKLFDYCAPPVEILDFTSKLCERFNFTFMTADLFIKDNEILVNELQTIFGHKNPYICKVNNKPGRYLFTGDKWRFEEGNFNTNESYDLRLKAALDAYQKSNFLSLS